MALWRTRALAPEQKAEIAEEQEERSILLEETGSIMDVDETKISKIYAAELPVSVSNIRPYSFVLSLYVLKNLLFSSWARSGLKTCFLHYICGLEHTRIVYTFFHAVDKT